jgi:hypothetical protein
VATAAAMTRLETVARGSRSLTTPLLRPALLASGSTDVAARVTQEIELVQGQDAGCLRNIGKIMQLVEQRLEVVSRAKDR